MGGSHSKVDDVRSTSSSAVSRLSLANTDDILVVKIMMPLYYTTDVLTPYELEIAENSWNQIIENTSPAYTLAKNEGKLDEFKNCQEWFQVSFYERSQLLIKYINILYCYIIFLN